MDLSQFERRNTGNQNVRTDFTTGGAADALRRGYEQALGRTPGDYEIESQLAGQGLKPGDRFVGQGGLQAILNSLAESEEGKAYKETGRNAIDRQNESSAPATSTEDLDRQRRESHRETRRNLRRGIAPTFDSHLH